MHRVKLFFLFLYSTNGKGQSECKVFIHGCLVCELSVLLFGIISALQAVTKIYSMGYLVFLLGLQVSVNSEAS